MPRGISVAELTRIVLQDLLRKPFVLAPEVLASTAEVGISADFRKLKKDALEATFRSMLDARGFQVAIRHGVWFIDPKAAADAKPLLENPDRLTYQPKHRPVSYFASALPGVFPEAKFSFEGSKGKPGAADAAGPDVFYAQVPPAQRADLLRLISDLDTPVRQVEIRAYIVEYTTDRRDGSAVQAAATLFSQKLGIAVGVAGGGNTFSISTPDFSAVFAALDAESGFRTIASPHITAEHGQQARFQHGAQVPVLDSVATTDGGTTRQSVSYKSTGVILSATPQVFGSSVSLALNLELSDAAQTATGVNDSPTITTRSITTQATLQDGATLVLSGLTSEAGGGTSNRLFGFPLGRQSSAAKTEVLLVLHARIL